MTRAADSATREAEQALIVIGGGVVCVRCGREPAVLSRGGFDDLCAGCTEWARAQEYKRQVAQREAAYRRRLASLAERARGAPPVARYGQPPRAR